MESIEQNTENEESMMTVTIRLPTDLLVWVDSKAKDEDRPRGGMIRKILKDAKSIET